MLGGGVFFLLFFKKNIPLVPPPKKKKERNSFHFPTKKDVDVEYRSIFIASTEIKILYLNSIH